VFKKKKFAVSLSVFYNDHFAYICYSNIGNDDRRTRQGYKSGQIRQACALMEEMAANINVHQQVIDRAKEE
jgi:hypothetical protein